MRLAEKIPKTNPNIDHYSQVIPSTPLIINDSEKRGLPLFDTALSPCPSFLPMMYLSASYQQAWHVLPGSLTNACYYCSWCPSDACPPGTLLQDLMLSLRLQLRLHRGVSCMRDMRRSIIDNYSSMTNCLSSNGCVCCPAVCMAACLLMIDCNLSVLTLQAIT
jgi:hypothetical protein